MLDDRSEVTEHFAMKYITGMCFTRGTKLNTLLYEETNNVNTVTTFKSFVNI